MISKCDEAKGLKGGGKCEIGRNYYKVKEANEYML
tara:strand:- start:20 stop:124 length:105 start_codon:yes stop_codon:yes gene_type:complete